MKNILCLLLFFSSVAEAQIASTKASLRYKTSVYSRTIYYTVITKGAIKDTSFYKADFSNRSSADNDTTVLVSRNGIRFIKYIPSVKLFVPVVYKNTSQSFTATCATGFTGTNTATINAGAIESNISVSDANNKALAAAQQQAELGLQCRANPPPAGTILLIQMGESNLVSRAQYNPAEFITQPPGNFWYRHSTNTLEPMGDVTGEGNHAGFSMNPKLSKRLKELTGKNVIILPCATGATTMGSWMKGTFLYAEALKMWNDAIAYCAANNITIVEKYVHWLQGGNDILISETDGYYVLENQFVNDVIADFGAVKVFSTRIGYDDQEDYPGVDVALENQKVMRAKKILGFNNPSYIESSYKATTFNTADGTMEGDKIHFSLKGQNILGEDLAQAIQYYRTTGNKIQLSEPVGALQEVTNGYINLNPNWKYNFSNNLFEDGGNSTARYQPRNGIPSLTYNAGSVNLKNNGGIEFSRPFSSAIYTIEIRLKLSNVTNYTSQRLLSNFEGGGRNSISLEVSAGSASSYLSINSGGQGHIFYFANTVNWGSLHTLKITQGSGLLKCYLDGIQVGASDAGTAPISLQYLGTGSGSPATDLNALVDYLYLSNTVTGNETGLTLPPTSGVVSDMEFAFTPNPLYNKITDYEYTLNGGSVVYDRDAKLVIVNKVAKLDSTITPLLVGNINSSVGKVGIRVKATATRPASEWLFNNTAYTTSTNLLPDYTSQTWTSDSIKHSGGIVTSWNENRTGIANAILPLIGNVAYIPNAINGHGAIQANATQTMVTAPFHTEYSRFAMWFVLRVDEYSEGPHIIFSGGVDRPYLGYGIVGNNVKFEFGVLDITVPKNEWVVLKIEQDATGYSISSNLLTDKKFPYKLGITQGNNDPIFLYNSNITFAHFSFKTGPASPAQNSAEMQRLCTKYNLPVNPAVLSNKDLAWHKPVMKIKDAVGSIAEGSNVLTLNTPAGYTVGDKIIVETGGESPTGGRTGGQHGTWGVGGGWPSIKYPSYAAMAADNSKPMGSYVFLETDDTLNTSVVAGRTWRRNNGFWSPLTFKGYYGNYANPFALWARVDSVSADGMTLWLDTTATRGTTNANVYFDNYFILKSALDSNLDISLPEGGVYKVSRALTSLFASVRISGNNCRLLAPNGCEPLSFTFNGDQAFIENIYGFGNGRRHGFSWSRLFYKELDAGTDYGNPVPGTPMFLFENTGSIGRNIHVSDAVGYGLRTRGIYGTLFEDCFAYMTEGDHDYAGWYVQSEGGGPGTVFRRIHGKAKWMVHGAENFASDGAKWEDCDFTNFLFASNSSANSSLKNITLRFTPNSKPSHLRGSGVNWYASNPSVEINSFAYQQSNSGTDGFLADNVNIVVHGDIAPEGELPRGFLARRGTPYTKIINSSYTVLTPSVDKYYKAKAVQLEARYGLVDNFTFTGVDGAGEIAKDNNFNIQITYGNNIGVIKNTDVGHLVIQEGVDISQNVSYKDLFVLKTEQPPAPVPGGVIDRVLRSVQSPELFLLPTGINEDDLMFDEGEWRWFYDDKKQTQYKHATTIEGLKTAVSIQIKNNLRYPTIVKDAEGKKHVWAWVQEGNHPASEMNKMHHYKASTWEGLATAALNDMPTTATEYRYDLHVRPKVGGGYIAGYISIDSKRDIHTVTSTDLVNWKEEGEVMGTMRTFWQSDHDADPAFFEVNGNLFLLFAGNDGFSQNVGIVQVDPITYKALTYPYIAVFPAKDWHKRFGKHKVFNPIPILVDGELKEIYYKHNGDGLGPDGWGKLIVPAK